MHRPEQARCREKCAARAEQVLAEQVLAEQAVAVQVVAVQVVAVQVLAEQAARAAFLDCSQSVLAARGWAAQPWLRAAAPRVAADAPRHPQPAESVAPAACAQARLQPPAAAAAAATTRKTNHSAWVAARPARQQAPQASPVQVARTA
jgi:hypothetical protein